MHSTLVLVLLLQFLAENLALVQFESFILASSPGHEVRLVLVFPQMQSRCLPLLRLSLLMILEIPFAPQFPFLVMSHSHELLPPLLLRQRQPFPAKAIRGQAPQFFLISPRLSFPRHPQPQPD